MRDSVLATLVYYDVLDFPLKAEEVLRYLIKLDEGINGNIGVKDVRQELDQLVLDGTVGTDNGFYYLSDRNHLVPLRIKKEKISRKKWKKAKSAIKWLKFLPYVEAVFASGSLALGNCDELSDLDVLVVVRHGRIWLARLFVSGVLSLLRIRRKWSDKIAPDKICLNHYITDESLKIPFRNLYNAQTYANLRPLLLKNKIIFGDFYGQNSWLGNYLLNPPDNISYDIMIYHKGDCDVSWVVSTVDLIWKLILNTTLGDWLEKIAKKYQIRRIENNPLTRSKIGHVVYSDEMLAFHPDSPESQIIQKYENNLEKLKTG